MAEPASAESPVLKVPVLKVMVSSTIVDLPEHREQVEGACLDQDMLPLMMEHQPASYLDPVQFSLDLVNQADAYVGVYAHRYGYVPDGYQTSLTEMEQALAIDRETGDRRGEGQDLGNLGLAYADLGETRRAIEYYEQALVIGREIGDRRGEGRALFNMSLALDKLGERAQAIAHAQAALAIFEQIEDPNAERVRRQLAAWKAE